MAYVPDLFNQAAALFIPLVLASFFNEIQYHFNESNLADISPSCNTLSNIIEEASIGAMLDLARELSYVVAVFVSSYHGNKKDLHYFVKVLLWWSNLDNYVK